MPARPLYAVTETVRPSGVPATLRASSPSPSRRTQRPSTVPSVPNGLFSRPGCSGSTSQERGSSEASSRMPERSSAGREARPCVPVAGSYSSHTVCTPCLPWRHSVVPSPITSRLGGRTVSPACRVRPPVARPPPGSGIEGAPTSFPVQ